MLPPDAGRYNHGSKARIYTGAPSTINGSWRMLTITMCLDSIMIHCACLTKNTVSLIPCNVEANTLQDVRYSLDSATAARRD